MKLTRCDFHPDCDAVATFKIRKMPVVGMRPLLIGIECDVRMVDLCEECAALVEPFTVRPTPVIPVPVVTA